MPDHESPELLTYAVRPRGTLRLQNRADTLLVGIWVVLALAFTVIAGKELAYNTSSRSWTTMWESAPLQVALHAAHGEPIYGDWYQGPVHLAIYGPLYYRVLGWLGAFVHADPQALIPLARWWSIFCMAAGLVGVVWFIRGGGAPWWAALIGLGCTGLLTGTAVRFIASARPDAMATTFSCLGLACALGRSRLRVILGAVLLSLAWSTKVTSLAAALTLLLALAWRKNWRSLVWFAGTYALLNALSVVALTSITHGWFLKHLNVASSAPAGVKYVWQMLAHRRYEAQVHYLFVFPALAFLTVALGRAKTDGSTTADTPDGRAASPSQPLACVTRSLPPTRFQVAGLFFLFSALIALSTAMRQGSDRNYLIEPTLAAGMVMGTWAARVARWRDQRAWAWTRAAACFAFFSPMLLNLPDRLAASGESDRMQRDVLSPYQDEAMAWAQSLPQPLLCLDSWLAYKAGVFNDVNDPIAYSSYAVAGGMPDPIAERIRRRYYRTIVTLAPVDASGGYLYGDITSNWPSLSRAVRENYRAVEGHGWQAYTPLDAAPSSRPEAIP